MRKLTGMVFVAVLSWAAMVSAVAPDESATASEATADDSKAVFKESLDVTSATVRVAVVDKNGVPRKGLEESDFTVTEGGERVDISSFVEVGPGDSRKDDTPRHLVILVDNANLQKRGRNKILDEIASVIENAVQNGRLVMVATLAGRVETVQEFTDDPVALKSALQKIEGSDAIGEQLSSSKRNLTREIRSVDLHRDMRAPVSSGNNLSSGSEYIGVQGQQYLQRIQGLRQQDMERWQYTLFWVDHTVRSLAGIDGRKDLVWVTEDIQVSPLFDVYTAFFSKFSQWQRELGLEHPEVWARSASLVDSFTQLAMISNASGVSLHVVDISNRDRRSADMAMDVSDVAMFAAGTPSGERTSTGDELSSTGTATGSARAMAASTGGLFFVGTRDFEEVMTRLESHLGSFYEIAYHKVGQPDGQLHPLEVKVAGAGLDVVSPRLIGHRTALQELADRTLTRLQLGVGNDQLTTRIRFGGTEPGDEDKLIRTVHVEVGTDALKFEQQGETLVGSLVLVFQSMNANGMALPPQVLQQPINVPAARIAETAMVRASARLMTAKDAQRLAVGVLDQLSGAEGTTVAEILGGD